MWDWDRVLVVSQFQPDEPWKAFRAMTRNQLIIALSRVMIVIEAGENGGYYVCREGNIEIWFAVVCCSILGHDY